MMNRKNLFIGVIAGLATCLMAVGASMGTALAMPLFLLSPIAILIAGLGWGTLSAIIASIIATLLLSAFSSPLHAGVSLVLTLIPATWAAHMAGLSRDDNGVEEWYPLSNILFYLALYMALAFCIIGVMLNFNPNDIAQMIEQVYRSLVDVNQLDISQQQLDENITSLSLFYARLLPYTMPAFWLLMFVVNLYFATKITRASNMMLRPQDDIPFSAQLPKVAVVITLGAFAVSMMESTLGQISATVAGSLLMAFTLIALAFVHAITRDKSIRLPLLIAIYISAIVFGFPLFILALIGMGETLFNWRYRQPNTKI